MFQSLFCIHTVCIKFLDTTLSFVSCPPHPRIQYNQRIWEAVSDFGELWLLVLLTDWTFYYIYQVRFYSKNTILKKIFYEKTFVHESHVLGFFFVREEFNFK